MGKLRELFTDNGDYWAIVILGAIVAFPFYLVGIVVGSIWLGLVAGFKTMTDDD